ncbi:MAG: prephenate dehydratase [Pyrinomonadaceae bacterium]
MSDAKDADGGRRLRCAFQGERGAFSEEAAVRLLGEEIELVPCATFEKLFATVGEGAAELALAPVENTLAGSVHRVYELLAESRLRIAAEVVIPIAHHLVGCPGAKPEQLQSVESHPVALAQCERFFAARPHLARLATDDTAASVRRVVSAGDPARAAIGSRRAAEMYGGAIFAEHLEDHAENYTRFVLLAHEPRVLPRADKLSLVVKLAHRPGALHAALAPFARRGVNLQKIESRPVRGRPFQYLFYLDLQTAPGEDDSIEGALGETGPGVEELVVLGRYPSAAAAVNRHELLRSLQS